MQSHIPFSFIKKGKIVIFVFFLLFPAVFTGCGSKKREAFTQAVYAQNDPDQGSPADAAGEGDTKAQGKTAVDPGSVICVFVCGAVEREGVYYLPEGSRVIDAVTAAGGYREDADKNYVNQAEYVRDAERIEIPTQEEALKRRAEEEAARKEGEHSAGQSKDSRININTASRSELMQIPGIGESKADRIISYREDHGRFGSIEEITNVSGIGSGIYEGLRDYITVE